MRERRDGKKHRPKAGPTETTPIDPSRLPRRGPGHLYRIWIHPSPNYNVMEPIEVRAKSKKMAMDLAVKHWDLNDWECALLRGVILE